ncbi:MAG TPA: deoxyribose-phosphate aldolase [Gemmatimonadales bacterium]|nr:deoxyribose-phosphate aldolase [Gemmatimonadales bacterium]
MTALSPWLRSCPPDLGLAGLVDLTLLKPETTEADILRLCEEAVAHRMGAVCVNGQWAGVAAMRLRDTAVRIAVTVGFPLGATGPVLKAAEARLAVLDGATELDMVMAVGWAKAGEWDRVGDEIAGVVDAARGRLVKVILETAVLLPEEIRRACRVAVQAGAGMVKTSTGFHPAGGATVEAVRLLRQCVGDAVGVKASGGVRSVEDACRMLLAGANRLGSSSAAGWGPALYRRLDEYLAGHDAG